NPNFGIEFWEKNLNKANYFKMLELFNESSMLKSDLKANNDNFYWNIWQGLKEYAKKLDIYDEQLGRRLVIKPILYESPISTMGFDRGYETNQNHHIGELDNMAQNIKVESESNDLTQVNRSLINEYQIDNSHTSSRDTNTQED
ncbi:11390_t:CDS:1, partial [Racocetra fulgida]